jgi:hypothetical protein
MQQDAEKFLTLNLKIVVMYNKIVIKNGKAYKVIYCRCIRKNGKVYYPKKSLHFRFLVEL